MNFSTLIDINYVSLTVLLGLVISKKISAIVETKKIVLTFILMSIIIPFINIIFGIKLTHHLIEFMTIWGLVYYFELNDFNKSLFIASIFSLSFSICRYILIFTYVTTAFYFEYKSVVLDIRIIIAFQIVVLILIFLFILFIIYLINRVLENRRFTRTTIAIILIFLVIVLVTGTVFDINNIDSELVYRASISSIFIAIDTGIICVSLYKKNEDIRLKSQVSLLNDQLYYQERYYEKILKNYEYARRAKHDLKNHINIIRYFLETQDYNSLQEYLDRINKFIPDSKEIRICGNKIINAICVEKLSMCREKKIKVDFDIDISGDIKMELVTLCVVYGNLIDNAIEACEKISDENTERFIEVTSAVKFNKIYIRVVNSKINKVKKRCGRFVTSKKDKKNHGLGLDNVKYVVYQNSGYIEFKDLNNVFEVNLYMNLKK